MMTEIKTEKMNISFIGIVQEELQKDFWGTIEALKAIGYCGVESVLSPDMDDLDERVKKLNDMGMPPFSASVNFFNDDYEKTKADLEFAKRIGAEQAVMYYSPCETEEDALKAAKKLNELGDMYSQYGIKVCYHNHDHEFRANFNQMNGIEYILANTNPDTVFLQVDTGWSTYGGADTPEFIKANHDRIFSLHLKDFSVLDGAQTRDGAKFAAVGSGLVPIAEIVDLAQSFGIRWASIEQDQLSRLSPMENLAFARYYIKEKCGI